MAKDKKKKNAFKPFNSLIWVDYIRSDAPYSIIGVSTHLISCSSSSEHHRQPTQPVYQTSLLHESILQKTRDMTNGPTAGNVSSWHTALCHVSRAQTSQHCTCNVMQPVMLDLHLSIRSSTVQSQGFSILTVYVYEITWNQLDQHLFTRIAVPLGFCDFANHRNESKKNKK